MSGPLNPPRNMWNTQVRNLGYTLRHLLDRYSGLNPATQQKRKSGNYGETHAPNTGTPRLPLPSHLDHTSIIKIL